MYAVLLLVLLLHETDRPVGIEQCKRRAGSEWRRVAHSMTSKGQQQWPGRTQPAGCVVKNKKKKQNRSEILMRHAAVMHNTHRARGDGCDSTSARPSTLPYFGFLRFRFHDVAQPASLSSRIISGCSVCERSKGNRDPWI
jgi:hypothetical protein